MVDYYNLKNESLKKLKKYESKLLTESYNTEYSKAIRDEAKANLNRVRKEMATRCQ